MAKAHKKSATPRKNEHKETFGRRVSFWVGKKTEKAVKDLAKDNRRHQSEIMRIGLDAVMPLAQRYGMDGLIKIAETGRIPSSDMPSASVAVVDPSPASAAA